MAPRRRVTIKDVATATGLSPAAVSYALRGVQTSPETQERVRLAAEELGYTGNAVARALAQGRTGLVGVLAGSLQDLGEQRFVQSVGQALEAKDLHMVLIDSDGDPGREQALARQLADQLVDGLVVSPLDPSGCRVGGHRSRRCRWSRSATRCPVRRSARSYSTTAPACPWCSSTSTRSATGTSPC